MDAQAPPPSSDPSQDAQLAPPSSDRQAGRPWRTEGVPKRPTADLKRRWFNRAIWIVGYLLLFGVLTIQDRLSGPEPVPYTEFKTQVSTKNIAEVFAQGDSIEGQLKKVAPVPGQQDRTYHQFTTERPTFASDDLLAELTDGGAIVRATPLVQHRGIVANLLMSFAPLLLLVAFYVWMFRRQRGAMAGGLLGGGKQKRVDPETVRVTFDDVAGIDAVEAEINEVVDFLKNPGTYRRLGARGIPRPSTAPAAAPLPA